MSPRRSRLACHGGSVQVPAAVMMAAARQRQLERDFAMICAPIRSARCGVWQAAIKLYFPNEEPLTATLAAFRTYFIGFVGRPIGAAIFGHYGDRIAR
jgi:hypothetical protein